MRWEQTEFLLKGVYLGFLVVAALHSPKWFQVAQLFAFTFGGLVLCLGVAGFRKIREGYRVRGRWAGFLLFLLLENPGLVYTGIISGMAFGTYVTFIKALPEDDPLRNDWTTAYPILGGAALGILFYFLRTVRNRKQRNYLALALAVALVGGAIALLQLRPDLLTPEQRPMLGILLLLGIPGFYLLTFASLVEESEIEIAAICAALGLGLYILAERWTTDIPNINALALVVPLMVYYLYTRRVLPGLKVFKHALRGLSYFKVGQVRPALASLNRALQLNPGHPLARDTMWELHRQMDVAQVKNDPETLALVNYDLCLERAGWLLLQDKPRPEQIEESLRLLELVASQRDYLAAPCAYWRAVAWTHQRKLDDAAASLESVLQPPAADSPQRKAILFQAWLLALMLHPELNRRVGSKVLVQPGRRMEAIAAVERKLAIVPDAQDAWDLKRLLYGALDEAEYNRAVGPGQAVDFDHAYVQQLGLALVDDKERWRRGCEYLRLAARGLPADAPNLFIQIAKTHEKWGDVEGMWTNYRTAMTRGRQIGAANLRPQDREAVFAVVKQIGDDAIAKNQIDTALEAFKFYTQSEKNPRETYRTLAELFEKKPDIWQALHCTEHGLTYDEKDKDLLAKKDRYYFSIAPAEVKEKWDAVQKWFDFDYCLTKSRSVLDRYNGDLDLLDWGQHLAELAHTAKPASLAAKVVRARLKRLRGEIAESQQLLEEIRQNKPEKFANNDEEESWFLAHRLLGDMYLDEKPDQAVLCFQEYKKSDRAGADTMYKLGRAYENLGDFVRAAKAYEHVTAFEEHPLFYDARAALERVKRQRVS